jgi:hypothetical protein
MLQNTTKLHFGSNEVEWMHLVRNHFHNFGTSNSAFRPETQDLHFLHTEGFLNATKDNHTSFGVHVQWMHLVRNHFATSACQTQVLNLFTCPRIPKCSKTQPKIILVQME